MAYETETEAEDSDFKPLTAQEAQEWRKQHPAPSVWWLTLVQVLMGCVVVALAWWVSGKTLVAYSAAYGALCVVLPAMVFARGALRQRDSASAAVAGIFGWELVKILLTVAMLAAAPRLIPGLSWLAMIVAMVVVMKAYWVALWTWPRIRRTV